MLHRLCHWLNEQGHDAALNTNVLHPTWNTKHDNTVTPETIVVYPEIVHGNPLRAKRVVRYVLNHPGLLGGDKTYAKDEAAVYYAEYFRTSCEAAATTVLGRLYVGVVEPELFHAEGRKGQYDACYIGKGWRIAQRHPEWMQIARLITAQRPLTREKLGDVLRQTKTLYSYDHMSAINHEARLCGARVMIVQKHGTVKKYDRPAELDHPLAYEDGSDVEKFAAACKERWS